MSCHLHTVTHKFILLSYMFGDVWKVFPLLVAFLLKLIQAQITSWSLISKNSNHANLQEQCSLCSLTSCFFLVINITYASQLKWWKLWKTRWVAGIEAYEVFMDICYLFWALWNLSDCKSVFTESSNSSCCHCSVWIYDNVCFWLSLLSCLQDSWC